MVLESEPEDDYEALREKKLREREAFFASLRKKDEHQSAVNNIKDFEKLVKQPKQPRQKRKSNDDETFRFNGHLPRERRKSARIAKQPADDICIDFDEEIFIPKIRRSFNFKIRPKTRESNGRKPARIIPPEDITDADIANIAKYSSRKVYAPYDGTTCHQCRQKTADTKTVCRSGKCFGVRGQFCGPCLRERYAEDVAEALKDAKWSCPVCLDECNCSFCRAAAGKPPTGILAPLAKIKGYKSVKHFLLDYEGSLVGFKENGEPLMR